MFVCIYACMYVVVLFVCMFVNVRVYMCHGDSQPESALDFAQEPNPFISFVTRFEKFLRLDDGSF